MSKATIKVTDAASGQVFIRDIEFSRFIAADQLLGSQMIDLAGLREVVHGAEIEILSSENTP